jgi:hypothetical protein
MNRPRPTPKSRLQEKLSSIEADLFALSLGINQNPRALLEATIETVEEVQALVKTFMSDAEFDEEAFPLVVRRSLAELIELDPDTDFMPVDRSLPDMSDVTLNEEAFRPLHMAAWQ